MKKFKRIFAFVLTAAMVVCSMPNYGVETDAATSSSVTIGGFITGNTGREIIEGNNFDVTYTFTNKSNGSASYENYCIEVFDYYDETKHVRVRADNFVMTTAGGATNVALGDYNGVNWDTWNSAMQAGTECTVNVKRQGENIFFSLSAAGTTFSGKVYAPLLSNKVNVTLTGENVSLTNVVFTKNSTDVVTTTADYTSADYRKRTGDFDITYTFHNKSTTTLGVDNANGHNYLIELRDNDNNCINVRADRYGWTWTSAISEFKLFADNTNVLIEQSWTSGTWDELWAGFTQKMIDGVDVTVNIVRTGDKFVITTDNTFCKFIYTVPFDAMGDEVQIGLGGEKTVLSNIVVTENFRDGKYNIANYRSGSEYTAPTKDGKVFAGWFTDSTFETPVAEDVTTGYAYAKFVDESLLYPKYQLSAGTTAQSASTNVRVMLGVDSLDYTKLGFEVDFKSNETIKYNSSKVYSKITVGNNEEAPSTYFGNEAKYMLPLILKGLQNADFSETITVKGYWVTLDGTTVYGTERAIKASDTFQ